MKKEIEFSISMEGLEDKVGRFVKNINTVTMKAINSTARKIKNDIAKLEAKTLGFKTKKFENAIEIERATKERLAAKVLIPDNASEVQKNGKTYLMIPIKSGLKNYGIDGESIKKGMANDLLYYSRSNPRRKKRKVETPHAFFNIKGGKVNQDFVSVRKKENRKKMNWLYVGREGKEPDFEGLVKKITNEHLPKAFIREAKRTMDK